MDLTPEKLKEFLHYDKDTGVFTWKKDVCNRAKMGNVAGCVGVKGYVLISIDYKRYTAHRLAWLYHYNEAPPKFIDHINGKKEDNRICNLRPATQSQNAANCPKRSHNKTGYKGVCYDKRRKKFLAQLQCKGKMIFLGYFDDPKEAHQSYKEGMRKHFGEYAKF